jgi:hypothetical protein
MSASDNVRSLLSTASIYRQYIRIPMHRLSGGHRPGVLRIGDYSITFFKEGSRSGARWKKRREFSLDGQ